MQILTGASPSDNYGWYQGQFFDQVEKVYAQKGIARFLSVATEPNCSP
jgi:hypothetical protein